MSQTAKQRVIAIDAMGGDHAPGAVVDGLDIARLRHSDVRFLAFGDEAKLKPLIDAKKGLGERVEIRHAPDAVGMDDKPSLTLRRRTTSLWRAIEAVKNGEAVSVVSAGNTGAFMAMAYYQLRPMEGIARPALAALWPTQHGQTIVLDVGANLTADARHLLDFAVMGAAYAHTIMGIRKPLVALLNVGAEEMKGNEAVRQAAQMLREANLPIDFQGFVEGDDISAGVVDVIVTDGFTGNVALKAAEGTARLVGHWLRGALRSTWMSKIGAAFASGAFRILRAKMDPRSVNGGVFLGLNGVVVKSHGGADGFGFAAAVDLAADLSRKEIVRRIAEDLRGLAGKFAPAPSDEPQLAGAAGTEG